MNTTERDNSPTGVTPSVSRDECLTGTETNCIPNGDGSEHPADDWLEDDFMYGMRVWHAIVLGVTAVLSVIILLCCCFKFRIPRTKQEIEADYIRRKILRKFRARLKAIQNQELDEMDLKRALDKIRAEFKSDTESLALSETGFSVGTISSSGQHGSTYRRASQIAIPDISLEDFRAQSLGVTGRMAMAFSKFFGRSKVGQTTPTTAPKPTEIKPPATAAGSEKPNTTKDPKNPPAKATTINEKAKPKPTNTKSKTNEGKKGNENETKDSKTNKAEQHVKAAGGKGTEKVKSDTKKPENSKQVEGAAKDQDNKKTKGGKKDEDKKKDDPRKDTDKKKDDTRKDPDKKKDDTKKDAEKKVDVPKKKDKAKKEEPKKDGTEKSEDPKKEPVKKVPDVKNMDMSKKELEKLEKEKKKELERKEKEKREQEKLEKARKDKEKAEQIKQEKERAKLDKQREKEAKEKAEKEKKGKKDAQKKDGKS